MALGPIGDVLRALEEAAATYGIESKNFCDIFGRERWQANRYSALLRSTEPIVDPSTVYLIMASAFQINSIVSMLTSLLSVALEFHEEHQRCVSRITSKLSKGIESLPDELLPVIFDFAVRGEGRGGMRQVMRLSQVSRRFHNIVRGQRNLWRTLAVDLCQCHNHGGGLRSFVTRSGQEILFDVYIDIDPDTNFVNWEADIIREALGSSTHRWRTLSVRECDRAVYDHELAGVRYSYIPTFFMYFFKYGDQGSFREVHALEELHLEGDNFNDCGGDQEQISYTIPLDSPNLRLLRCLHYVPSPSPAFSSVTTFSISKSLPSYSYQRPYRSLSSLLIFLASMSSLASLELEIINASSLHVDQEGLFPPCLCALITSFQLRLPTIKISQIRRGFFASFFRAIRMPLLDDLTVDVGFQDGKESESERSDVLSCLSIALLSVDNSSTLSQPSSIAYGIGYRGSPTKVFSISLESIPSVSILTVTSNHRVVFTREEHVENASHEPISLSELKFVGCSDMELEDVAWTILSLQGAKVWYSIERVTVENCHRILYDDMVKLVGAERLAYS